MSVPPTGWVTRADAEAQERLLRDVLRYWTVLTRRSSDDAETLRRHAALVELFHPVLARVAASVTAALLSRRRGDVATLRAREQHEKADRLLKRDRDALELLDVCLALGLTLREHVPLRHNDQLWPLEYLLPIRRQLAPTDDHWPAGAPSLCRRCTFVFRPRRYAYAETCDFCERHPNIPPPFHQEPHPDGRGFTMRLLPSGVVHMRRCEVCDEDFEAGSRTAVYCRKACSKAASRARRNGEPVRVPAPTLSADERAACRAYAESWADGVAQAVAALPLEAPGIWELGGLGPLMNFKARSRREAG